MRKTLFSIILSAFLLNSLGPVPTAQADDLRLPSPGVIVPLSLPLNPPMLKGIKVHPEDPLRLEFILDQGDSISNQEALKNESTRLIKYFLATLTIPEKDLWVNLSPYEKDRIIPKSFGLTEMGRDLLAEDYMLKQITASLIYPEDQIGKKFWKRIYEEADQKYGTTNIPINTFNKVWIVPSKAVVYENVQAGTAYVVESKLKVMLEQDYLSLQKHSSVILSKTKDLSNVNALGSKIVREIVIPELTKEVNTGKNFAQLRQVYNSLILATWYKKKIKDSILERVYENKNKIAGVNGPDDVETIYRRYLQAFKKGVYNYIKEDIDPFTREMIPRKYFSGGALFTNAAMSSAMSSYKADPKELKKPDHAQVIDLMLDPQMSKYGRKGIGRIVLAQSVNQAMNVPIEVTQKFQSSAELFIGINRLIEDLTGPDQTVRNRAAQVLAALMKGGVITLEDLRGKIDLISHLKIMRSLAAPVKEQLFASTDVRGKAELPHLLDELTDPDRTVCLMAAQRLVALGKMKLIVAEDVREKMDLTRLLKGLIDRDSYTRLATAQVLKMLRQGDLIAVEDVHRKMDLRLLFKDLRDPDNTTCLMAAQGLAALAQGGLLNAEDLFLSKDLNVLFERFDSLGWDLSTKILLAKSYYLARGVNLPMSWKENLEYLFGILPPEGLNKLNVEQLVSKLELRDPAVMNLFLDQIVNKDFLKGLKVSEINLTEGGNAVTNFKDLMPIIFASNQYKMPERPQGLPKKNSPQTVEIFNGHNITVNNIAIDVMRPDERYGRTLVYNSPITGKRVFLKFLKKGENPDNLSYEHDLMNFFNLKKQEWGLQGNYPRGRIKLGKIPAGQVPFSPGIIREQDKDIELYLDEEKNYVFMAYETDLEANGHNDYKTYENDPDLSHEEFLKGLMINVHDRMVLAAHGLFDLEIIELFHNQENAQGRRYDWMIDMQNHEQIRLQQARHGAGRLNDVTGATRFPNICLSGPTDFPEIYYIGDMVTDAKIRRLADDRIDRLLSMVNEDESRVFPYLTSALLGDTMLALSLMPSTYLLRRKELSYQQESQQGSTFLRKSLGVMFKEAYRAYTGMDGNGYEQRLDLDISLIARQMAYFMTDQYLQDHRARLLIPESLYPGSIIDYVQPLGLRGIGEWDTKATQYDIPSRNGSLKLVERSFDLGPVNGQNPLQALIRAFYIATPVMVGKIDLNINNAQIFNSMEQAMLAGADDDGHFKVTTQYGSSILLADPDETILPSEGSRKFELGIVEKNGAIIKIFAVESLHGPFYRLSLYYQQGSEENNEQNGMIQVNTRDGNRISILQPFQNTARFGDLRNAGLADILMKYLFTVFERKMSDGLASETSNVTFQAVQLYLRQALVLGQSWPQAIAVVRHSRSLESVEWHSIRDGDYMGKALDKDIIGHLFFQGFEQGNDEWTEILLKATDRNGTYRIYNMLPKKDGKFKSGDEIQISLSNFIVFHDGKPVGRIIDTENQIIVHGFSAEQLNMHKNPAQIAVIKQIKAVAAAIHETSAWPGAAINWEKIRSLSLIRAFGVYKGNELVGLMVTHEGNFEYKSTGNLGQDQIVIEGIKVKEGESNLVIMRQLISKAVDLAVQFAGEAVAWPTSDEQGKVQLYLILNERLGNRLNFYGNQIRGPSDSDYTNIVSKMINDTYLAKYVPFGVKVRFNEKTKIKENYNLGQAWGVFLAIERKVSLEKARELYSISKEQSDPRVADLLRNLAFKLRDEPRLIRGSKRAILGEIKKIFRNILMNDHCTFRG